LRRIIITDKRKLRHKIAIELVNGGHVPMNTPISPDIIGNLSGPEFLCIIIFWTLFSLFGAFLQ